MADDLLKLWENFTLTEEEDFKVAIPGGEFQAVASRGQNCIIGKLIAEKMVSMEALKTSLTGWWRLSEPISFRVLGENLFLIDFRDREDKDRAMAGRPWSFEGNLFLIEDFDGTIPPSEFTFDKAAFWIRMFDFPLACMGAEIGKRIGASVGVVEAVDTDAEGIGWGEFLRMKILIDLSKPLPRGRKINLQGTSRWITFKYERLPKFCFQCGVIVHGKSGCSRRSSFRYPEQHQEYGPWLRASSPTRRQEKNAQRSIGNQRNTGAGGNGARWGRESHRGRTE
jgi:hypothetical protein